MCFSLAEKPSPVKRIALELPCVGMLQATSSEQATKISRFQVEPRNEKSKPTQIGATSILLDSIHLSLQNITTIIRPLPPLVPYVQPHDHLGQRRR